MKISGSSADSDRNRNIDRRQFPRFDVPAAYTAIRLRLQSEQEFQFEGHALDVSEGGVQFESDMPIDPGTPVAIQIMLAEPMGTKRVDGPGRAVFALGNVVWCNMDEPGPARMAMVISRWSREGDRERLLKRFGENVYVRAA